MEEASIPVVLAIDAEPDEPEFELGNRAPWRGLDACFALVDQIRDLLGAEGRSVHVTWFLRMDPQIRDGYGAAAWAAHEYERGLNAAQAAGDEIGIHPHAWRWDTQHSRWKADVGDEAWLRECLAISLEAYANAFGAPCRAHRAGDRFMSNALLAAVREQGITVDMTPEPGLRGVPVAPGRPHTADVPDMDRVPRRPFLPSPTDWRAAELGPPRPDSLLTIPLTAADIGPLLGPLRASARRLRNVRWPLHRPLLPWATDMGPRIWDVIAADVRAGELTALAFAMRSHAAIEPAAREALLQSIAALARHDLARSLEFVRASEARTRLLAQPSKLATP